MKFEFEGAGIRPPGIFHMECEGVYVKMNTCIFISALHKLMRRNETNHLNCIMKGAFIALSKRELTAGIKSVWTQYRNRVFITLIEEGVLLFMTPEKATHVVKLVINMFQPEIELQSRLEIVDVYCKQIDGCYRGRVPSFMNSWFMTSAYIIDKLNIQQPPNLECMSAENVNIMLQCKLSTKKGKKELKTIINTIGSPLSWIHNVIDEISHAEFNKLLYYSAVASLQYTIENDIISEYNGDMKVPSFNHLKDIGVLDCHSGKGDFDEFLDKGVLVSNKAPIKLYGFDGNETENMYIMVKKEIGSQRWQKKQELKEMKRLENEEKKKKKLEDKNIMNVVKSTMSSMIESLENKESEKPVIAQLPTGKHKPMVVYNVRDGMIDGSGYKKFKIKNQYIKCKQHDVWLRIAGSPAMANNIYWDDQTQTMQFKPINGTLRVNEERAIDKISFNKDVRVLDRNELGVKMFRNVDDKDIISNNIERFVKHCIVAALLNIGDQSPNNFILTSENVIYSVDNADKRTKFNMNETNLLTLLTNKPMKKGSLLRNDCENYIQQNSNQLKEFISGIKDDILKVASNNKYDWDERKRFMMGLL